MTVPGRFDLWQPRDDVAKGTISDSDYAANLANVLTGRASRDYTDPRTFFTNTYPTRRLEGVARQRSRPAVGPRRKNFSRIQARYVIWLAARRMALSHWCTRPRA